MIVFPGLLGAISKVFPSIVPNIYLAQQQVLSGSLATNLSDYFGWSVDINHAGDRIVVGAISDERSGGSSSEGLAYLFVSGTSGWTQQHIFSGSLAIDSGDNFGYSVSINSTGDRVVVGARSDERTGGAGGSGLAYLFVSGANGWTEQHIFSGSLATNSNDYFGWSVAINSIGDRIVVGTYLDERSDGSNSEGLAYVFVSGANGWTEQHILSGSLATATADYFGWSVDINHAGDRIVVGANQDEIVDGASNTGLAYLFVSGTNGWTEQQIFSGSLATDSGDQFGASVAINNAGDRVVVGANWDEKSGASDTGLAYLFVSGNNGWTEQHIFSGSLATDNYDYFGYSVAINSIGDCVVVGARADERSGGSSSEGLAYVFVSGTDGWTEKQILSGSLAINSSDYFGYSVAINSIGDRAVVGANQDERSGGSGGSGLAYIFDNKAS